MLRLLPFLALLSPAFAQVYFAGNCPAPTVLSPLNATKLTSPTWYEAKRYYSWLEGSDTCVNWKFVSSGSGTFTATTSMRNSWGQRTMTSKISQKNPTANTADFSYQVTKKPGSLLGLPGTYSYQILAMTSDYMLAWSCKNKWFKHQEMFWLLTAAKDANSTVIQAAKTAASTAGLRLVDTKLVTVQQNC